MPRRPPTVRLVLQLPIEMYQRLEALATQEQRDPQAEAAWLLMETLKTSSLRPPPALHPDERGAGDGA